MIHDHISGVLGYPIFMYKSLLSQIKSIMIYFDIKNLRICFSFGFFFVVAFLSVCDDVLVLYSLVFCLLHELAHLFWMRKYGINVSEIRFYGAGIKISSSGVHALSRSKQILIYSAGCSLNIVLAIIYLVITAEELCVVNLLLAFLNMLPIGYLDGGKILGVVFPNSEQGLKLISNIFSVLLVFMIIASAFIIDPETLTSSLITAVIILLSLIFG